MQKKATLFSIVVILTFFYACRSDTENNNTIQGIWQSIGYGKILNIEKDSYAFYDITKLSCLPSQQGKVSAFGNGIKIKNDTLYISKGTGHYYYKRLIALPDLCNSVLSEGKKKDPMYNFAVMAQTIEDHYAYFERNKINWDSLYSASKAKLTSNSTDPELYLVLKQVINSLKDNHGYLEPTDAVYKQATESESNQEEEQAAKPLKEYGDFEIAQMVAASFLEKEMTRDSWLLQWGKMKDNVGYIQVKSMWLYADLDLSDTLVKKDGYVDTYVNAFTQLNEGLYIEKEVIGVSQIMDNVMADLRICDYIILDVRFNGGGQDAVSMEILRRFNDEKIQVASKRAIYEAGFTREVPIYLEASVNAYKKPVYLLTSQQSASATDFLALASLELTNFKRIGAHTNGALSDALEKKLPNDWYFSISNEVYTDLKGVCYESIGIPVDYDLSYPEDRQSFFATVAGDLQKDKKRVVLAIEELQYK